MGSQVGMSAAPVSGVILDESPVGLTWTVDEPLRRTSHALVDDGRVWLIDPTSDPAVLERVAALGRPAAVIQLLDRHNRDCAAVAARLGVPLERVPQVLLDSPFLVVPVLDLPLWHEVALWWSARRTLVVAEALGTAPLFVPAPGGVGVSVGLRLWPPRRLASFEPEHLLVSHGAALHGPGAAPALREAIERARRDLPEAMTKLPGLLAGLRP
jgi:hypothetical protein